MNSELLQLKTNEEILTWVLYHPIEKTDDYYKYTKWLANFLINDLKGLCNKRKMDISLILTDDPYISLSIRLAYYVYGKKWLLEFFSQLIDKKLENLRL